MVSSLVLLGPPATTNFIGRGAFLICVTVSPHWLLLIGDLRSTPAASTIISSGSMRPSRTMEEPGEASVTDTTRTQPSSPRLSRMPMAVDRKKTSFSIAVSAVTNTGLASSFSTTGLSSVSNFDRRLPMSAVLREGLTGLILCSSTVLATTFCSSTFSNSLFERIHELAFFAFLEPM